MPLSISLDPDNTSVPATYWVIDSISINFSGDSCGLEIVGYASAAAYAAGNGPLYSTSFNASGANNPLTKTSLATALTNLYNLLPNSPGWSGATVVP